MRLVSYRRADAVRHGRLDGSLDDGVITELGDGDVTAVITGAGVRGGAEVALAEVELLAPLQRPGKLLAVAANYQDHVREGGGPALDRSRLSPRLFLKPPTAIVGPDAVVAVPDVTTRMDWEAELGVVIGRGGRHLAVEDALDAVFGYVAANDVSARSLDLGYERDTEDSAVKFFDWLEGKWCDGFAPMGPWILTADEVPDPQALGVRLTLNGEVRQSGSTADMIFTVAELVAFASRLMTLEPGDVLLTGTPAGVGAASGRFLTAGDEMTVSVDGLGALTTKVA
jgi:2-keto-4-pentenoate hydratase/2-oxohepta-3-ene-1,7-dioic acid hydratase in catechol pathway